MGMRTLNWFFVAGSLALAVVSFGFFGCASEGGGIGDPLSRSGVPASEPGESTEVRRLPAVGVALGGEGSASGGAGLDLRDWVHSADDFLVGTINGLDLAWEPMGGPLAHVDVEECVAGRSEPALDVHLVEVRSLRGAVVPDELTVRLGPTPWSYWNTAPEAQGDDLGWTFGEPALVPGMQLGGAVYEHVMSEGPIFLAPWQPLFEVVSGEVWFQEYRSRPSWPGVDAQMVEKLNGLSVEALRALVEEAVAGDPSERSASYRATLGVDERNEPYASHRAFAYGAICHQLKEQEILPEPDEPRPGSLRAECGKDSDCAEDGAICVWNDCDPMDPPCVIMVCVVPEE